MSILSSILTSILCVTAPLASDMGTDSQTEVVSNFKLGKEIVAQARSDYENGKYNEFLSDMDESYQKADLKEFIEMRSKSMPEDLQEVEQQFLNLQKQKNQALLSALSDEDDSTFSKKVRFLAADHFTQEQEKSISKLNSFLSMAPNSGKNADENLLIQLDLEYEYKLNLANGKQDRQIALRMEKMDKMVQASKNFEDASLKQTVSIAAATLDTRLARNLDGAELSQMARQNQPNNATEETVYTILKEYQGQFADLMRQLVQK